MCRRFSLVFVISLVSVIIYVLLFGGFSVSAEIVYSQMTASEAYEFYGDYISCTYYSSSGYKTVNLVPSSSRRVYYRGSADLYGSGHPSWVTDSNLLYVCYNAVVSDYSNNPAYLGLDISPNVHFSDCNAFRFVALAYCGNNNVPRQSTYSDSFIFLNNLRYTNSQNVSQAGYYPSVPLTRDGVSGSWQNLAVWADYSSDVLGSVNLTRIGFNGARLDDGYIEVYLSCPQYNSGAVAGTGLVTDSSGSGSSGSSVDMSETNGILGRIVSGLSTLGDRILDGLRSIFIPQQGYFDSKIAQVNAKFAWYEVIVNAWTEFKTSLNNVSADSPPSITFQLDNRTFFGKPIGSGSGTALVLDWMITYRNTIRNLLSAFMWIFFLWRLYCHIPNIISGSGMEVQKTDEGAAWMIHGKKL